MGVGRAAVERSLGDELVERAPDHSARSSSAPLRLPSPPMTTSASTSALDEVAGRPAEAVAGPEAGAAGGAEHRAALVEDAADVGRGQRTDPRRRRPPVPAGPRRRRRPRRPAARPVRTTARTAAFMPAESPPLVSTASLVGWQAAPSVGFARSTATPVHAIAPALATDRDTARPPMDVGASTGWARWKRPQYVRARRPEAVGRRRWPSCAARPTSTGATAPTRSTTACARSWSTPARSSASNERCGRTASWPAPTRATSPASRTARSSARRPGTTPGRRTTGWTRRR